MIEVVSNYISTANTWLVSAVLVGIMFQQNAQRLYASAVFCFIGYAHEYFMYDFDGIFYYGSASVFAVVAAMMLGLISHPCKMIVRLQFILLGFEIVNFIGWLMWYAYLSSLMYNALCAVLFALALITLILRDKQDVGGFSMDSWISCFRFNGFTMRNFSFTNEKKI